MKTILIFFAVHGRPKVTKLCVEGLKRLQEDLKDRFFLRFFSVYSKPSDGELLRSLNIECTQFPNSPLGAKMNHGLREAMKIDFDYFLHIGSDDLVNPKLFDYYEPWLNKNEDVVGIDTVYFLNTKTNKAGYYKNQYMLGGGRMTNRKVLEGIGNPKLVKFKKSCAGPFFKAGKGAEVELSNYMANDLVKCGYAEVIKELDMKLWPDDRESALDANSHINFLKNRVTPRLINTDVNDVLILALKTGENIHSWEKLTQDGNIFHECESSKVFEFLSEKEINGIRQL